MPFLLLAIFILFHSPSGDPIYVARDQVVVVTRATGSNPNAHTMLVGTGPTNVYLSEQPDEVVRKLGD